MKTAILSTALAFISLPTLAQTNLEDFTSKLVHSLKTGDQRAFVELIHPESLQRSIDKNKAKHNKKIKSILETSKLTDTTQFELRFDNPQEMTDYNRIDNSVLAFGGYRAVFNRPLHQKMSLYVTTGNISQQGQLKSPHLVEFLTQDKGRWYILWPTKFIKN